MTTLLRISKSAVLSGSLGFAALLLSTTTLQAQVERGMWKNRGDYPDGWAVVKSKHYQIQSQVGQDKAQRLADHMEKMLHVYKKTFKGSSSQFSAKPVKLFKDREAYIQYGGSSSSAGYYSPGERELVLFDSGNWSDKPQGPTTGRRAQIEQRRRGMDVLGVAAHEGWHQFFHWYVVSLTEIPSWVNEGMGDYFFAGKPVRKGRKLELDFSQVNTARFPVIFRAVEDGQTEPFEKFLLMSQQDYYANANICYAQGWALCYFLNQSENRKYKRIVPLYIKYIRDDSNWETVTKKAFRGIDVDKLEEEFVEWVRGDLYTAYKKQQGLDRDEGPVAQNSNGGERPSGRRRPGGVVERKGDGNE